MPAHHVFNAHAATATSPAKGNMSYEDQFGSYTAAVTDVSVEGANATISAQVTSSNYLYATVGQTLTWMLHDEGEQGVGADTFTWLPGGRLAPVNLPAITAGNIQVHS